ncbi:NHLP family bacteriocin export ABC transporter peptidase/permease/ATPase subunit [Oscillospiraceae bacterium PP1C4]
MRYKKTPTIFQMEATECGAASLTMIFAYYGRFEPLEKMRIETGVSRDGCNAKNLLRAARKYGFIAKGFRKELEDLDDVALPCIIHWNFNHFVVLEGKKGKDYYINDPGVGRRKLTYDDLDSGFTGVVLTFQPSETFEKSHKKSTLMSFIKTRLKGQVQPLSALVLFGVCLVLPGIAIPIFSQVFIDDILLGGNNDWVTGLIYAMVFTVLFQALLTYYRGSLLQSLQTKLSLISANQMLSHMFRLPISFFDQRYAGDLSSRIESNNNVSDFLGGELAEAALNIFVALFYLIIMLAYNLPLTMIGILAMTINIIVMSRCSKVISDNSSKMQQDIGRMVGALYSGISISSTLKASGVEGVYSGRILGYYVKSNEMEQQLGSVQQMLNAIPETFGDLSEIAVLMFGGLLVIKGQMTAGMLVAFSALLTSFTTPINKMVGFMQNIQTLKADMGRVDDIMSYAEDEKFSVQSEDTAEKTKLVGGVELRNISFGYSRLESPLVENFHFRLEPGNAVALVGASGSGKSTVGKIVSGLYLAWDGEVYLDGKNMQEIPKDILNSSVATVSQDITIFSATVRDNLTLWNSRITDADLVRAAKDACIHDVITRKPGAYDFKLSEGGRNLSGGQRQRLEIARALAVNPTILIMDEATSALDPIVEKQIMDHIKRRGCTCIIVAHRLSTIRDCDEIIVMEHGKIVQRGTHETLMEQPGQYQRLLSTF